MYSRHSWIRAAVEKERRDAEFLRTFDPVDWYRVNLGLVESTALRSTFLQSAYDAETQQFLQDSTTASNNVFLQLFYSLGTYLLHFFMTKTSQNGLLHRGEMFIFSSAHLQQLLGDLHCQHGRPPKLLDLGAGDGGITANFGQLTKEIFVTEMSAVMQWRLKRRGFTLVNTETWRTADDRPVDYDLIAVLNLIDRHSRPLSLLAQIRSALSRSPNPLLLLAVVLPWSQYVEYNSDDHRADESILVEGKTFEQQVENFVNTVIIPAGFKVARWTRLPYLCAGDSVRSFYHLTDVVFVLIPVDADGQSCSAGGKSE